MDEIVAQRRCTKCGLEKPVSDFYKDSKKGKKHYWCKRCEFFSLKKWRSEHPEQAHAQVKKWAEAHHEYIIQKAYRWATANKEKHRASISNWEKKHADKMREVGRKSRVTHPEREREKCRNRRARLKGCDGTFTEKEWQEVLAMYGNRCLNPDCPDPTRPVTRDHVIPINKGGSNTKENIQPLCRPCNSKKKDDIIDYRK